GPGKGAGDDRQDQHLLWPPSERQDFLQARTAGHESILSDHFLSREYFALLICLANYEGVRCADLRVRTGVEPAAVRDPPRPPSAPAGERRCRGVPLAAGHPVECRAARSD